MPYDGFLLDVTDRVAQVTFNRPEKLNAITWKMGAKDFPQLLREIQENDTVRVVVITGAGEAFCAGLDVNEFAANAQNGENLTTEQKLQPLGPYALSMYSLNKPIIAAINGVAAGLGVSVAMLSDIRIASEKSALSLAFVKRGLIPDSGATWIIPKIIGVAKSLEYMYTGKTISADLALELGLINKVVPHENCLKEARLLAEKIAEGPPLALTQIRRAVYNSFNSTLEQQLYFETYAQTFLFSSEDFKEGVSSFLEKRKAHFKGK
jgi:2-(1,2-epoxy-1,2-dihydrophenyl)acetyl-CoA isomerase